MKNSYFLNQSLLIVVSIAFFSAPAFGMNDDIYDLDYEVNDLLYGEQARKNIQAAVLGYLERKKLDNLKKASETVESLILQNKELKRFNTIKKNTETVQSLIRANNERKKFNETKDIITNIQNIIRGNKKREESKTLIEGKKQNLKKFGSAFDKALEKQVEAMVKNLAKSVGQENNTEEIAQQTKQLTADIQKGARIVYMMNFETDKNFSWHALWKIVDETDPVNSYIKALQQACSYYYYVNAQQRHDKVGFTEGTFFIETTNGRWKTFFDNLTTQVSLSKRPSAYYERISSHSLGEKCYGMDFRATEESYREWLYRFKTFLISETERGFWIKPEHYGCYYWSDTPVHLKGWITSQAGKRLDPDYYNKPEENKERTPESVIREFEKLFSEYQGEKTLATMYCHAQKEGTTKEQKEFAKNLKQKYSNIIYRHGCECYVDVADLLTSYFIAQSNNKELFGYYAHLIELKNQIALLKNNKLDQEKLETIKNTVHYLRESFAIIKTDLTSEVKDYCERLITVLAKIINDKNALKIICEEQIFEIEFQKEFLLSEKEKEEKAKKLKEEAQTIEKRDEQKIKLAQKLTEIISNFCAKANNMLDIFNRSDLIKKRLPEAPYFRSAESKKLQILLSSKDGKDISSVDEAFGLDDLYDETLFQATHNLNNDTTGLRKITELRTFNYTNSNPYVTQYYLDRMECITELAVRICKIAWAVKCENNDSMDKKLVIKNLQCLSQKWNETLDIIYETLEKHGYEFISKNGKGKEITKNVTDRAQQDLDVLKKKYADQKEEFETAIKSSDLKESNKERFIKKYAELYNTVINELDFTFNNLFDFIAIRIQVAKTEDELKNTVSSCLDSTLKQYTWENPMMYSAERLKLFHEVALKEITKEENQMNLLNSVWGNNFTNTFN